MKGSLFGATLFMALKNSFYGKTHRVTGAFFHKEVFWEIGEKVEGWGKFYQIKAAPSL